MKEDKEKDRQNLTQVANCNHCSRLRGKCDRAVVKMAEANATPQATREINISISRGRKSE